MDKFNFIKKWFVSNIDYYRSRFVHSKYSIPRTSYVHSKVKINADLVVGSHCSITAGSEFIGGSIKLGNCVIIGPSCCFFTDNHSFGRSSNGFSPYGLDIKRKPIKISDNVWLGRDVVVTPGTHIGSNSIISAGSVLFGEYPANSIIKGNPAVVTNKLTVSKETKPITMARTLRLNLFHFFLNLNYYKNFDLQNLDTIEMWKWKYVYWASKFKK